MIGVLAAGLAACAGTATDPDAANGNGSADASVAEEPKKRCYREKETGSRLGKRVCVTVDD